MSLTDVRNYVNANVQPGKVGAITATIIRKSFIDLIDCIEGGTTSSASVGFFNISEEFPLQSGNYTKETAVHNTYLFMSSGSKYSGVELGGMICTYYDGTKWCTMRFNGTNVKRDPSTGTVPSSFDNVDNWEEFQLPTADGLNYVGIATASTTPIVCSGSTRVFYVAKTAGTYTNFGGLTLAAGEIAYLCWRGTAWTKETFLNIDQTATADSSNAITSAEVKRVENKIDTLDASLASGDVVPAYADDLMGVSNDRVTSSEKFIIRTTAGDLSIKSDQPVEVLDIKGGTDNLGNSFTIARFEWRKFNLIDPALTISNAKITGSTIEADTTNHHSVVYFGVPACTFGTFGTAEENNGVLLTNASGVNLKAGDGTIVAVKTCPVPPTTMGTAVYDCSTLTTNGYTFHLPSEVCMLCVELNQNVSASNICAHMAWSIDYDRFEAYAAPSVVNFYVSPFTTTFDTGSYAGDSAIVLRGLGTIQENCYDHIVLYGADEESTGGYYERKVGHIGNLGSLTWNHEVIETVVEEGDPIITHRYTYSVAAMLSNGLWRCASTGFTVNDKTITYDSSVAVTTASEFNGITFDYQMANPTYGTHSVSTLNKYGDDMSLEVVKGGVFAYPYGTITTSYVRGLKDYLRSLPSTISAIRGEVELLNYSKPKYCVSEWLTKDEGNSIAAKRRSQALNVYGDPDWCLDWRPFLVDMSYVEGEVAKEPVAELQKNNWLRDVYGNFQPVVGIADASYNATNVTNANLWVNTGSSGWSPVTYSSYIAGNYSDVSTLVKDGSIFNPTIFYEKFTRVGQDSAGRKTFVNILKLYDSSVEAEANELYVRKPWETKEKKYSIFVGRKDGVYLIDNLVGQSGKEWNGIFAENVNFWDGIDIKPFKLPPTGICPSPTTAIKDASAGNKVKIRSFFYNYPGDATINTAGYNATNAIVMASDDATMQIGQGMFYNNGTYPVHSVNQLTILQYSWTNNIADASAIPSRSSGVRYPDPNGWKGYPVAEGGYHLRNTFLRSIEVAYGNKYLNAAASFSSGISSNDACANEADWRTNGGVRTKRTNLTENWEYRQWGGTSTMLHDNKGANQVVVVALNNYAPHVKCLESQIAASVATEMGVMPSEEYNWNYATWRYENVNNTAANGIVAKGLREGHMNAKMYKICKADVSTFTSSSTAASPATELVTVEAMLRIGLMEGCDLCGDVGVYWGGGAELIGTCVNPSAGSTGNIIKAYVQPDQTKWIDDVNVTNGDPSYKFACESKYYYLGQGVDGSDWVLRRLPYSPIAIETGGGSASQGECSRQLSNQRFTSADPYGINGRRGLYWLGCSGQTKPTDPEIPYMFCVDLSGTMIVNYYAKATPTAQVLLNPKPNLLSL